MRRVVIAAVFAASTLTACVVSPGPPGSGAITVSPLPPVIILGADPYYYQDGYYYYYHNDNWSYSRSRRGPWNNLPRSHWPKEIRHRDRDDQKGRGWDKGHGRDRDDHRDHGWDNDRDRDERQEYDRR